MFEKLLDNIEKFDSIVIFGHINPDGDCYGSQIALRKSLSLAYPNKHVYAVGSGYRRFDKMLGEMDVVDDHIIEQSLAILVDANDLPRSEDKRIEIAKAWIKIDHHVDIGSFTQGDFVVDEDANSCCEIITDMIRELNLPIDYTVSNGLYLGILTDTGRFQYIKDFPKAFQQVGWLCENGADPKELNRILNITSESSLAFKGYVYSNYKKTETGTIYLFINKETLNRYNLTASKAGSMVNLISNLSGYPIWAFFCENDDGSCHAEFRSNGPAVQPIAASHGGGGHVLAAGVTLEKYDEKDMLQIIDELDEAIKSYKAE